MRRWTLAVAVLAVALGGCEDRRKKAMEKVGHDEELLRKVGAAVNEVVRNAADCEVAKPLMIEAYRRRRRRRRPPVPAAQPSSRHPEEPGRPRRPGLP